MALEINHNPDVLLCLANLSNDEVFTPPNIANAMLDLLPEDLWSNPEATFLDPCCKSGVFLREIAKRLIKGLERKIPNLEERLAHIYHKQLFGIAITELTALLSRRSLYCSKHANSKWSVVPFDTPEGNIAFPHVGHTWDGNRCIHCGASKDIFGDRKETHAYALIHDINPEELFKMKFDVIIGNPPYQLNVGVEKENYAIPIYQKFVEQAKKLRPRYLEMIIPARWYAGGRGLDEFRKDMLNDREIIQIHDYPDSTDCFPQVDIAGGVCYFLWENRKNDDCLIRSYRKGKKPTDLKRPLLEKGLDTFIRHNDSIAILRKVRNEDEKTFESLVSPQTPFGFVSSFKGFKKEKTKGDNIKYYTYGSIGYVNKEQIQKGFDLVSKHKLYISAAYGERGDYPFYFLGKPFYGELNSCCSQSYLVVGPFNSKQEAINVSTYIATKFFRFMIMLKKNAQHNMRQVFQLVPMQDFSKPWTDEELYKKYKLTKEEIAFIESMIKPMEVNLDE